MNALSLKPYPAYKDSGVPWLGEVPEHWEVRRAKTLLAPIDVRSESGSEELLTVSSNLGVIPRNSANVTMFKAESYVGYKLCWPCDLVINSLWAWARGLGVSRYHGIISTAYGVYRKRINAGLEPWFLHELVRSEPFHWELRVRSKGIWTSRLQLTDEAFLGAPIVLPPLPEQTAIVRFLDWADWRIRRAIRARKRRIELLEEYKQAIIHQAITGQIDVRTGKPYPKYKDSGIEWLGRMPKHWKITNLGRLVSNFKTGPFGSILHQSDYVPDGIPVINPVHLSDGMIVPTKSSAVSKETADLLSEYALQIGDIVFARRGELGRCSLVETEHAGWLLGTGCIRLRIIQGSVNLRYIIVALRCQWVSDYLSVMSVGATMQNLNTGILAKVPLLLPAYEEQESIVQFIDEKTTKIHAAITADRRVIDLLEELRTRLVADVVTGKLDVREAAARLPEEHADDRPESLCEEESGGTMGGFAGGAMETEIAGCA